MSNITCTLESSGVRESPSLEVRRWAREWGQSASVLVLVPGAAEMGRLHAEWLSTRQTRNQKWIVVTVSSDTPQGERQRIRSVLDSQQCDRRYHSVLVIATSVFEASVTLDVNGVIDTGLPAERDFNDFLQPVLCNGAQSTQRRGRAGRIRWSLFKKLRPQGFADSQQQASYRMPKSDHLSVLFAAVCLGKEFPVIGISPADAADRYSELRALAVIAADTQGVHRLTDFGAEVRRSSLDVRLGILSAVCSRFDLPWHGRIAAAYGWPAEHLRAT